MDNELTYVTELDEDTARFLWRSIRLWPRKNRREAEVCIKQSCDRSYKLVYATLNGELTALGVLIKTKFPWNQRWTCYQVTAMAGNGKGGARAIFEDWQETVDRPIYLNAAPSAIGFYEKMGCKVIPNRNGYQYQWVRPPITEIKVAEKWVRV